MAKRLNPTDKELLGAMQSIAALVHTPDVFGIGYWFEPTTKAYELCKPHRTRKWFFRHISKWQPWPGARLDYKLAREIMFKESTKRIVLRDMLQVARRIFWSKKRPR